MSRLPDARVLELAWASGLFEGEGCITHDSTRPKLSLSMADEDVVRRFHSAVGIGAVLGPYGPYKNSLGNKPYWVWHAWGFGMCQAVVALLWSGISSRRREKWKTEAAHVLA